MTTTIWERVYSALSGLGVPLAEGVYQVSSGSSLPATFMVFTLISSVPSQHADDDETLRRYRVQVSIYSTSGLRILPDVDSAMTAAGFAKAEKRELPFDTATGHYGLAADYMYQE